MQCGFCKYVLSKKIKTDKKNINCPKKSNVYFKLGAQTLEITNTLLAITFCHSRISLICMIYPDLYFYAIRSMIMFKF